MRKWAIFVVLGMAAVGCDPHASVGAAIVGPEVGSPSDVGPHASSEAGLRDASGEVGPQADGRELYPGPCWAEGRDVVCTYSYDEEDRLVAIECMGDGIYRHSSSRSYEGEELVSWERRASTRAGNSDWFMWSTEGSRATLTEMHSYYDSNTNTEVTSTFDTDRLKLWGNLQTPFATPRAPDALLEKRIVTEKPSTPDPGDPSGGSVTTTETRTVTYTYEGSRESGTLTRSGSDGSKKTFGYDNRGRLITVDGERIFTYEDGRIVSDSTTYKFTTYKYDEAGNLVLQRGPNPVSEDRSAMHFGYGCWTGDRYCPPADSSCREISRHD